MQQDGVKFTFLSKVLRGVSFFGVQLTMIDDWALM